MTYRSSRGPAILPRLTGEIPYGRGRGRRRSCFLLPVVRICVASSRTIQGLPHEQVTDALTDTVQRIKPVHAARSEVVQFTVGEPSRCGKTEGHTSTLHVSNHPWTTKMGQQGRWTIRETRWKNF